MSTHRSLAQAAWEARIVLRNGEQLLLTIVIPVGLYLGLTLLDLWPVEDDRDATALATVWTVSILATCFTSLAIGTGFERRSGALRFLATTPLSRAELLAGKLLATLLVTLLSLCAVAMTALAVGWRPTVFILPAIAIMVLGGAALGSWAFVLAGVLRAEAVLAVANGLFLLLLLVGGIIVPLDRLPAPVATCAEFLPTGALTQALTALLVDGMSPPISAIAVLAVWLVVGTVIARRTFRWS